MLVYIWILGAIAAVLTVFPDPAAIFVCSAVASGCGASILHGFIARSRPVRITWLLAASLLIGYCFGTCSVEFSAMRDGVDALTYLGHIDPRWVAYALMQVMLASIVLLLAGLAEKPLFREWDPIRVDASLELPMLIALAVVAFAYHRGDMSIEGAAAQFGTRKIDILGAVCQTITPLLPPLAALGIVQSSGARRVRYIVMFVAAMLATLPISRRTFVYDLLVCAIAVACMSGQSFRLSARKQIAILAIAAAAIAITSVAFVGMRLAYQQAYYSGQQQQSIATILHNSRQTSFSNLNATAGALEDNLQDRPGNLVWYLAELGKGGATPSPFYGEDAKLALKQATPDLIYRTLGLDKTRTREIADEEILANEHFGLLVDDDANSVLTGGIIDFGFAGLLLYPLLLCGVFLMVISACRTLLPPQLRTMFVLDIFLLFLQTESSLSTYVAELRNLLLLAGFWYILHLIGSIKAPGDERLLSIPPLNP